MELFAHMELPFQQGESMPSYAFVSSLMRVHPSPDFPSHQTITLKFLAVTWRFISDASSEREKEAPSQQWSAFILYLLMCTFLKAP